MVPHQHDDQCILAGGRGGHARLFVALGALFFIGMTLLIDLPASSSEEGSADEEKLGPS